MIRVRMRGIEKTRNSIKKLNKRATDRSINRNIIRIFDRANSKFTPVDTGELQRSFYVFPSRKQIRIGWTAYYAVYVNRRGRSSGFAVRVAREGLRNFRAYGRTGTLPKAALRGRKSRTEPRRR